MNARWVEASAGTGKTWKLAEEFVARIAAGDRVAEIVVVTFTRAATAELRSRLRARLREAARAESSSDVAARYRAALSEIDQARIHTIHALCARLMMEHAFACGAPLSVGPSDEAATDVGRQALTDLRTALPSALPVGFEAFVCASMGDRALEHWRRALVTRRARPLEWDSLHALDRTALSGRLETASGRVCESWLEGRAELTDALLAARSKDGKSTKFAKSSGWRLSDDLRTWLGMVDGLAEAGTVLQGWSEWSKLRLQALNDATTDAQGAPIRDALGASSCAAALDAALAELERTALCLLWRDYEERVEWTKVARDTLEHDDFVTRLRRALEDPAAAAEVGAGIATLLVDEVQDTDPEQFRVFEALRDAGVKKVVYVGDQKQSIYAFRGADVHSFVKMSNESRTGDALDTTYRADEPHQLAVDSLFGRGVWPGGVRYPGPIRAHHPVRLHDPEGGAAMEFVVVRRVEDAGEAVVRRLTQGKEPWLLGDWIGRRFGAYLAEEVRRLLSRGVTLEDGDGTRRALEAHDVAILTRTRWQADLVQRALTRAGIRATVQGSDSVYNTAEAWELLTLLRALVEPTNRHATRTAMATDLFGATAEQIHATRHDDGALEQARAVLRTWAEEWERLGFMHSAERFVERQDVLRRWLTGHVDGERRVTNLRHLFEQLQTELRERATPASVLDALEAAAQGDDGELDPDDPAALRIDTDRGAVRVMTMHKSKGLTFPVVLCPFVVHDDSKLRDEKFVAVAHVPDSGWPPGDGTVAPPWKTAPPAPGELVASVGSPVDDSVKGWQSAEQLAEGMRVLYVGLTRAKHRTVVYVLPTQNYPGSAFAELLHLLPLPVEQRADARVALEASLFTDGAADDEPIFGAVREVAAALPSGAMAVRELGEEPAARGAFAREGGRAVVALLPSPPRAVARPWAIGSFTGLVRGTAYEDGAAVVDDAGGAASTEPDAAPQQAEVPAPAALVAERGAPTADDPGSGAPSDRDAAEVPLARFGRGPHVGDFFHAAFETLDFDAAPASWDEPLRALASRFGVRLVQSGTDWTAPVRDAIAASLSTPLVGAAAAGDPCFGPQLRLRAVPPDLRAAELEFHLPTGAPLSADGDEALVGGLAAAMAVGAATDAERAYAASLSRLATTRTLPDGTVAGGGLRGYLKGLIDLVFEHGGRHYVLDYKSNHLGPTLADYAPERLSEAMLGSDYYLQGHLYLTAVHRHLARTVPGYDYDRHVGGLVYLFVRGVDPGAAGRSGVWTFRPPRARIDALSALFDPGEA